MANSNELFELVKSLSKSEKRYFTLFADRQGSDKNYMKLFNVLDQMDEYDEAKLEKKLKKESFYNDIHVTKNYLQNYILRSMRAYNEGKSIDSQIQSLMQDGDFLSAKGLHRMALGKYKKAEKIGEQFERFSLVAEAQKNIINKLMQDSRDQLNEIVHYEQKQAIAATVSSDNIRLSAIYREIFFYFRINYRFKSLEDRKHFNDLIGNIKKPGSYFKIKILYHKIFGTYFWLDDQLLEAAKHFKEIPQAYEDHPHFLKENPRSYIIASSNYLAACNMAGQFDLIPPMLDKMEEFAERYNTDVEFNFQYVTSNRMGYLLNQANFEEIENLLPKIEVTLQNYNEQLPASNKLSVYLNMLATFFLQEKFSEALDWVIQITNIDKTAQRKDIQLFGRILQLIIHLELQNHDLLESLLGSAQRVYKKDEQMGELETVIFKNIRKLVKTVPTNEQIDAFKQFDLELQPLLPEIPKNYIGLEELIIWIEARSNGTTLEAIFKQRLGL